MVQAGGTRVGRGIEVVQAGVWSFEKVVVRVATAFGPRRVSHMLLFAICASAPECVQYQPVQ